MPLDTQQLNLLLTDATSDDDDVELGAILRNVWFFNQYGR